MPVPQHPATPTSHGHPSWALLLTLVIVGLVIYGWSLRNGFVWDDEEQVVNNTVIHSLSNLPRFFSGSTFNTGGSGSLSGLYYKPLMTTAFALLYAVFGLRSFWFHLIQLLLHLTNAILVFWLCSRLWHTLDAPQKQNKPTDLPWIPFTIALVFLVHPQNTEAVTYIASLQDTLFLCFGLFGLTLLVSSPTAGKVPLWRLTLLFLGAMLSKETAFVILLIGLVYVWIMKRTWLRTYLLIAGATLSSYALLRFGLARIFFTSQGLSPITKLSLSERLLNVPKIITSYLGTFSWPSTLVTDQGWTIQYTNWNDFWLPLGIVLILGLLVGTYGYYLWRHHSAMGKLYWFFVLWFVLSLGLHLQLVPLDLTVADRWFYLPMVGLLGLIGVGIHHALNQKPNYRAGVAVILVIIIVALSGRTIIRTRNWHDGLTLYLHDVALNPDSYGLQNNAGVELFRIGNYIDAKKHFETSTQLLPNWWINWNNLGASYEHDGDYTAARRAYQTSVTQGDYYLAYENLAQVLLWHFDIKEADVFIDEALNKLPYNGKLWLTKALSKYKLGDHDAALIAARNSYSLQPTEQSAYVYSQLSQGLPLNLP